MSQESPHSGLANQATVVEALRRDLRTGERFDRLTRLACRVLDVPMAGVSLVGERRQWLISTAGFHLESLPRSSSFCTETVERAEMHVIRDPADHARFAQNPFVLSAPPVRLYAGCPLHSAEGVPVGTLFVLDRRKRRLTDEDMENLQELAALADEVLSGMGVEGLVGAVSDEVAGEGTIASDVFRQIFMRAVVGMLLSDTSGVLTDADPAAARALGYERDDIVGRDAEAFTHDDDTSYSKTMFSRLQQGSSQRYQVEKRYLRKDGEVMWGRLTVTRIAGSTEAGCVLGILEDISEQVWARNELLRYQTELEEAKEAAEAANRNKSEFLAKMSHELRTPLNSVIGFAKIMMRKGDGMDPKLGSYLERIHANGLHLLGLINDILDLSKVEAGKLEIQLAPVSLSDLVKETVTELEGWVNGRSVALVADLPDGCPPLQTDRAKLKQILINLVGNALKFTMDGRVVVRVVPDSDGGPPLAVEVEDEGPGIPPDRLDAIFEAFQQADNSIARRYEGTGLGLTISRSLAQLLGFRLGVESQLGSGSTFRVDLKPDRPRGRIQVA